MARIPVELHVGTDLAAPPQRVAAAALSMHGVNHELRPWLRMSHPAVVDRFDPATTPTGRVWFRSWILLGGVLPVDRHALRFVSVDQQGFVEESSSWLERRWRHERTLWEIPGGRCRIEDRLVFEPRLAVVAPLIGWLVAAVFWWRHRRLVRRFGRT